MTLTHQASDGGYDGISGTVRVTITENDGGGGSGGGSGGGGGGGGSDGGGGGGGGGSQLPPRPAGPWCFKAPPEVTDTPSRTTLAAEGDVARIDLSALFAASDGGALTYFVASSDPTLATATIDGDTLTLASNEDGSEGAVTVTVTATDDDGLLVTLTFEVTVESMPRGLLRGWRRRVLLEQAMERQAAEVE